MLGAGLDEALIREVYSSPQGGSIEATAQALLAMGFGNECTATHTQVTGTQHQLASSGAQLEQQGELSWKLFAEVTTPNPGRLGYIRWRIFLQVERRQGNLFGNFFPWS